MDHFRRNVHQQTYSRGRKAPDQSGVDVKKPSTHTVRGILILVAGRSDDMAVKQEGQFWGHYLLET
jgi:hypothetical protein